MSDYYALVDGGGGVDAAGFLAGADGDWGGVSLWEVREGGRDGGLCTS